MQINSSIKYILNTKIRSWNQETALFYYKNDRTKEEFSEKNLEIENYNNYIIRNQYNNILQIQTHIDLINYDEFDILFKIRKSFKHNRYELINPLIIENKIKTFEYPLAFLDEKIWYPVKSENHDYPE
jgi:hypothetical protein